MILQVILVSTNENVIQTIQNRTRKQLEVYQEKELKAKASDNKTNLVKHNYWKAIDLLNEYA